MQGGNFKTHSKNGKGGIAKSCMKQFETAICMITVENALPYRSKRGHFDNFEEF